MIAIGAHPVFSILQVPQVVVAVAVVPVLLEGQEEELIGERSQEPSDGVVEDQMINEMLDEIRSESALAERETEVETNAVVA